jgi:hypothetical protein
MPTPEQVNEGRENKRVYQWFCSHFLEPVVGATKWKANRITRALRKFATPSDEAFGMVVYQNNYQKWLQMHVVNDSKDQTVPAKWTNGGQQAKNAKTKKFCGWAKAGLQQLNTNYVKVLEDRKQYRSFDKMLLTRLQSEIKPRKRKRLDHNDNELDGFHLFNSLPLSSANAIVDDSEDDDNDSGDGSISV